MVAMVVHAIASCSYMVLSAVSAPPQELLIAAHPKRLLDSQLLLLFIHCFFATHFKAQIDFLFFIKQNFYSPSILANRDQYHKTNFA